VMTAFILSLRGCFESPLWCIKTTMIPLNPP
jgi:hypothetical protein